LPRSKPAARRAARPRRRLPPYSAELAATWYDGKAFATDWTSWNFPIWARLLQGYRSGPVQVLEIGSWEGRSALFFVNYLPRARLTCVDTFAGGQEHREAASRSAANARFLRSIERRFDANTRAFRKRIEKIKAHSVDALAALGVANRRFDVAYIDGGHRAVEVYSDAALAWPLMVRGGMVIFDDYQWDEMPERLDTPKPGIDAFLKSIKGRYRTVHREYQVAIVKR
jgi:predicted O-methyltransferase YrrM